MSRIAVVGMACQYPDAASPNELWDNALAARRAFRQLPDQRMRLEDYWDADPDAPDRFYARTAAVIKGYEFDRVAYKIAGSTYRSTDLTHWLALDTAARALGDAGFPMSEGLPGERTGVVVGNTLTGEFSRANQLRLRWPYVRRTVAAALRAEDWDAARVASFLDDLEVTYKSAFPAIDEDTLAGGLSNTIAGRICNYFDLKGGGYTVDGACSSSLLSAITACRALVDGDLDVAVAGGVDLSIDPFEIIGFARTGALARQEMRVYDRNSNGFWPGEGCGMVVLMREADARRAGHRIYATIAGWGISSDGKGGITRPAVDGYQLALRRAYERTGFGIDTVGLFEGHGTGTAVGDATELEALTRARQVADPYAEPAAIGSVKGMIGHTKAAAGVAGLIKAAMAVHQQVIPPTVGCVDPHELLAADPPALRVLRNAEPWPDGTPVRAAVTAMGFGGINTHVVLDTASPVRRPRFHGRTRQLAASAQDVDLLLFDARSPQELRERVGRVLDFVPGLAYGELADLAATLHNELRGGPYRAAAVVSSPEDARQRLQRLSEALDAGEVALFTPDRRGFLGHASGPGRIGYLFPGQGSGKGTSGGALRRRFAEVAEVYAAAKLPTGGDLVATAVAQPRIVTGSMAGLRALSMLGLEATVAVGHSLGEIAALHWAGALDEETLLRVAGMRGRTMSEHSSSGTMAGLAESPEAVGGLLEGLPVVIAGYNGPQQTIVAGPADAVAEVGTRAAAAGIQYSQLAVSHAFHSPLVAPAAGVFGERLAAERLGRPDGRVISTVTGEPLDPDTDLVALLRRQITDPVLFTQAVKLAAKDIDLLVEVGPGRVLAGLATATTGVPAVALDTDDESLAGLLGVIGAAYVVGAAPIPATIIHDRLVRPLEIGAEPSFFANPCESAPEISLPSRARRVGPAGSPEPETSVAPGAGDRADQPAAGERPDESLLDTLRRMAAERAELPLDMVSDESRLLDDLHLSSITVGQLVNQAAQQVGAAASQAPANFATATLREVADALTELRRTEAAGPVASQTVAGAAAWSRAFRIDLDEAPDLRPAEPEAGAAWRLYAPGGSTIGEPLWRALQRAGVGAGVLVCLPDPAEPGHLELALQGAQAAAAGPPGTRFVLVQHGRGAAGLAKTLRLEAPHVRTTIVHGPATADSVERVVAEVAGTTSFAEVYHDAAGTRRVPVLRPMPVRPTHVVAPLESTDVLLVTGGGKGITAECALALASDAGAGLAVLGRSDPAADPELAANLERMSRAGVRVHYARADVTDPEQVTRAVAEVARELGPVTAVLHGAGRNEPAALPELEPDAFRRTFAPKVDGLRAVLDAVGEERLRLLVTFGSIIGRSGLRGEAHYATANEWLAELTTEVGKRNPDCRTVCLEWSVWSGVGMGERLSVVESLYRDGITPISPDDGVALLRRLLSDPQTPGVVVVSGRTEGVDTVRRDLPELPLLRFIDRPLVRYHGVELVTEVELNAGTDRYLADHLLDGNLLFPAVFGMEAMVQVATAVTGSGRSPVLEQMEFPRPIVVPPDGSTTVRIAATVVDDDTVAVAIRSAETGFAADHFHARVRFTDAGAADGPPVPAGEGLPSVPLEPDRDLYGDTLFQGGRFHRLRRYHRAAAREVDADVAVEPEVDWFAPVLLPDLLLADPGMRDALMHGNQVCVPHATLLPAGIERVQPARSSLAAGELRFCATERGRDGDTYVYDIAVRDADGAVVERWDGLRLHAVRKRDGRGPWVPALLGPYLERSLEDVLGARIAVAVEPDAPEEGNGRGRTAVAAGRALGRPVQVRHRPDGRPEVDGDRTVSVAHGAGVTLCAASGGTIGADLEPVVARPPDAWHALLGAHAELATLVGKELGEAADTAATRVWTAVECLQKAGQPTHAPLALAAAGPDGWLVLACGTLRIATLVTSLRGVPEPVVVAVCTEGWS